MGDILFKATIAEAQAQFFVGLSGRSWHTASPHRHNCGRFGAGFIRVRNSQYRVGALGMPQRDGIWIDGRHQGGKALPGMSRMTRAEIR